LLLTFPLRNLLFWWVYLYTLFLFSLLKSSIFFLYSLCLFFNDNMPWRGSIMVKSVWCPSVFLFLNGQNFLNIWEIFCYYFIEYITYPFGLHLFSFCPWFSGLVFWWSCW
jgi:hypothetical protein